MKIVQLLICLISFTRFVNNSLVSTVDAVELSVLVLLEIKLFDFSRRSEEGYLYKNVPKS